MRVWDIHPGYLSRESLLGQHVETHAIFSIISTGKEGYARHPETGRWRHNLARLVRAHELTVVEMELRGFKHRSPLPETGYANSGFLSWVDPPHFQFGLLQTKYAAGNRKGRIPLPQRGSQFWAQHKYAVMCRGYGYYKDIQSYWEKKKDYPIELAGELVAAVLKITADPMQTKGLLNTLDHLWGYFKKVATAVEISIYMEKKETDPFYLLPFFYRLACKYDVPYLKHSTVLAEIPSSRGRI